MIGRFVSKIRKLYQRMTALLWKMVFILMKKIPFLSSHQIVSAKLSHQFNKMPTSALSNSEFPTMPSYRVSLAGPSYRPAPRKCSPLEKTPVITPPDPAKFKTSDIVYLLAMHGDVEYDMPLVNSNNCIDLKILAVNGYNGFEWTYELISGRGKLLSQVRQSSLISANEYRLLKSNHNYYFVSLEDTELFPVETMFYVNDEYLYSPQLEIYIAKSYFFQPQILKLFKKCSI